MTFGANRARIWDSVRRQAVDKERIQDEVAYTYTAGVRHLFWKYFKIYM